MRYANNSNYRNDSLIRKESECGDVPATRDRQSDGNAVCVSSAMIQEIKRIIKQSEIMRYGTDGWGLDAVDIADPA